MLDSVSHAGLFRRGAVLVGTAAYQCYPPLLGAILPSATVMTQDADLATADLALEDALEEARAMGRDGWARPIERSLSQIAAAMP